MKVRFAANDESVETTERGSSDELQHLFFADHRHAEFLGFVELCSRVVARYDVIGFLTHRPRDFAARIFDPLLGLFALESRKRPGEDESLSRQRCPTFLALFLELQPRCA